MKCPNTFKFLLSALLIAAPMLANANIIQDYPALDVHDDDNEGDTVPAYVAGVSFDADATANAIVFDDGTDPIPLSPTDFLLESDYNGGTSFYEGSFTAGSLLSGTFSDLNIVFSGSFGGVTFYNFSSNVLITGGSLAQNGPTTMTGSFNTAGDFKAKIGLVPVPAAIWLFGSGLLGLVSVARRRA